MGIHQQLKTCIFSHKSGVSCSRKPFKGDYCYFHAPENDLGKVDDSKLEKLIGKLIEKSDGKWDGFNFPKKFCIQKYSKELNFSISARYSKFNDLIIDKVTFNKSITLQGSTFSGIVEINSSKFYENISLDDTEFNDHVEITAIDVAGGISFTRSLFKSSFKLMGKVEGPSKFNSAIFEKSANFLGSRNIRLAINSGRKVLPIFQIFIDYYNKIRRKLPHRDKSVEVSKLFYGPVHFQNVIFKEPKNILFKNVDLRRAMFSGTDVRDVKFIGATWYQQKLKRNGLYDEVWAKTIDYNTKRRLLPELEYTYRYIRISLESVKDYINASDFYIGEMDASRNQKSILSRKFFSIIAIYNIISRYGTNPWRALTWFLFFTVLHSCIIQTLLISGQDNFLARLHNIKKIILDYNFYIWISNNCIDILSKFTDTFFYSVQILSLQRGPKLIAIDCPIILKLNVLFSIIGPVIITMLVLSFRGRIKRH